MSDYSNLGLLPVTCQHVWLRGRTTTHVTLTLEDPRDGRAGIGGRGQVSTFLVFWPLWAILPAGLPVLSTHGCPEGLPMLAQHNLFSCSWGVPSVDTLYLSLIVQCVLHGSVLET